MRLLLGILVCGVMASAAFASSGGGERTVTITIENSSYSTDTVEVEEGETVRFELVNNDPISHEFIVGDEKGQDEHEEGTEAYHGEIPTEVTIPPGETVVTTVEFDRSGGIEPTADNLYGCHLPGHYDYGMVGRIEIG
jgi:uncharacterized cupredoxin-like copper-binding protein